MVSDSDEAFRAFVVSESAGLLRTAWMLTGDRALAEDLLQTALARTWPHWSRISREGLPAAYVRTVMVRTYASWKGRRWCGELPSEQQAADALGCSVGTVKTQASRGLVRLRTTPADRPEKERERQ